MCTVILLRRPAMPGRPLIAANRDERLDRAWDPPGRLVAGPARRGRRPRPPGGGTWMAPRGGVVATVLNRPGSLGPAPGKRSRGELPLLALEAGRPTPPRRRIAALPAGEWRPFDMVVADGQGCLCSCAARRGPAEVVPSREGVSMVTAHDPNDLASPRTARHLPRFRGRAGAAGDGTRRLGGLGGPAGRLRP